MFKTSVLIIALLFFASSVSADDYDQRVEAAGRYYDAINLEDQLLDAILLNVEQGKRAGTRRIFQKERDNLRALVVSGLVKTYSTREIVALSDFYTSPVGRSITQKTQIFMQDVMQRTEVWVEQLKVKYRNQ